MANNFQLRIFHKQKIYFKVHLEFNILKFEDITHSNNGVPRIIMFIEGGIYPFINNPLTFRHTQALV